jgi:hypothetical protein
MVRFAPLDETLTAKDSAFPLPLGRPMIIENGFNGVDLAVAFTADLISSTAKETCAQLDCVVTSTPATATFTTVRISINNINISTENLIKASLQLCCVINRINYFEWDPMNR